MVAANDGFPPHSVEKHPFAGVECCAQIGARAPFLSGFSRFLRCSKGLGQLAEVLGGGSEEKFVIGTARSAQSEPVEAEDPLEMGEEHLDLLP